MSYLQRILSKELMICLATASTLDLSSNPTHSRCVCPNLRICAYHFCSEWNTSITIFVCTAMCSLPQLTCFGQLEYAFRRHLIRFSAIY